MGCLDTSTLTIIGVPFSFHDFVAALIVILSAPTLTPRTASHKQVLVHSHNNVLPLHTAHSKPQTGTGPLAQQRPSTPHRAQQATNRYWSTRTTTCFHSHSNNGLQLAQLTTFLHVRTYHHVLATVHERKLPLLNKLEACRACVGRAQRKSTEHELCTVHSARRRKKKGGHTIPDVRTIIIIYEKSQMYHPCGARFARPITVRNLRR